MTDQARIAEITAGLTEAQRKDLQEGNCTYESDRCLCRSPDLVALSGMGIVAPRSELADALLTNFGWSVRAHLEWEASARITDLGTALAAFRDQPKR